MKAPMPIRAMTAMAPITIPAIAPPERPELELLDGDGDAVDEALCDCAADPAAPDVVAEADAEEDVLVLVA